MAVEEDANGAHHPDPVGVEGPDCRSSSRHWPMGTRSIENVPSVPVDRFRPKVGMDTATPGAPTFCPVIGSRTTTRPFTMAPSPGGGTSLGERMQAPSIDATNTAEA